MATSGAEEIEGLEAEIAAAMTERLPELQPFFVCPFSVEFGASEVWVVARSNDAALFISLETEQFGVGFLAQECDLSNAQQYPTAELAAQAFGAAAANGA
jgi:hypothetical protein